MTGLLILCKDLVEKSRGDMFVNGKWCYWNNMSVKHKVCTPNAEVLTINVRRYYIATTSMFICFCHYCLCATKCKCSLEAFKIITGYFNHYSLKTSTMSYFEHVKGFTRKDWILDQYYTIVKDAYACLSLPPLIPNYTRQWWLLLALSDGVHINWYDLFRFSFFIRQVLQQWNCLQKR